MTTSGDAMQVTEPCEACLGEGCWFRYLGEGDAITVPCDICDGTGCDQFGGTDA